MTSLAAWSGYDNRGPSSFYLVSDSRISWPGGGHWDFGRKLFAPSASADLFGYCGDVLFPSLVLSDALTLIELGLVFGKNDNALLRHEKLVTLLTELFSTYPPQSKQLFTIVHSAREDEGMKSNFFLWSLEWAPSTDWVNTLIEIPPDSTLVMAKCSGDKSVKEYNKKWRDALGGVCRTAFSSFCEALTANADPQSGGAPQLVTLRRIGAGEYVGVIFGNQKYLLGVPVVHSVDCQHIEWRDHLFQRCDCVTLQLLNGAQRQPRPRISS